MSHRANCKERSLARRLEREELTKSHRGTKKGMNGHLKSCSPNGTPRISIQPIQKSHAFNDPGQIQNDEKNSTWNTFNKYP